MIHYHKGYKYQLTEDYAVATPIIPPLGVKAGDFVELRTAGKLFIAKGYAWDGPSGPAIDTKNFMRGSLVHDALYQLIRSGELPRHHRQAADKLLRKICREDGMSAPRAWWVYHSVRLFGGPATSTSALREVLCAP